MLNTEKFKDYAKGRIELSWVKDGVWTPFHEQPNLVVYGAADILASAITGNRFVNGMYIAFENASVARYSEDASNDAAYYAPVVPIDDRGFVRVTTLGEPIIETTDPNYSGNKVTFLGVTDGTSFLPGVDVEDTESVFYHSALVSIDENNSQEDDLVFSCSDFAIDVTKIAGSQLGIRWEITFNKPTV